MNDRKLLIPPGLVFADATMATIHGLLEEGFATPSAIARALNLEGVPAPAGGRWDVARVQETLTTGTTSGYVPRRRGTPRS
jgi:hypothetical protein